MILDMAPGQHTRPFALSFDTDAEELSFPMIYFGQPQEFKVRATAYSMATSEIRRRDRRGVKSNHILYMAAKIIRFCVIDSLNVMFRANTSNVHKITRSDIENRQLIKETVERNESFMDHIPNSVRYWYTRKRDLFGTLSSVPSVRQKLIGSHCYNIYRFQNNLPADVIINATIRAELVNSDPVICCLYFDKLVDRAIRKISYYRFPTSR